MMVNDHKLSEAGVEEVPATEMRSLTRIDSGDGWLEKSVSAKLPFPLRFDYGWIVISVLLLVLCFLVIYATRFYYPWQVSKLTSWYFFSLFLLEVLFAITFFRSKNGRRSHMLFMHMVSVAGFTLLSLALCSLYHEDTLMLTTNSELQAWEKMWDSVENIWEPPHIEVFVSGTNSSGVFLDELMKIRNSNKLITNSIVTGFSFLVFNICAFIITQGWVYSSEYERHISQTSKNRIGISIDDLLIECKRTAVEGKTTLSWKRIVSICCTCIFASFLLTIITQFLPQISEYSDIEKNYLKMYQVTASGGPFWSSLTLASPLYFTLVLTMYVFFTAMCWVLLYIGVYLKTRENLEIILALESFLFSIYNDRSFVGINARLYCSKAKIIEQCKNDANVWFNLRHCIRFGYGTILETNVQFGVVSLLVIALSLLTYVTMSFAFYGNLGMGIWGPWTVVASPLTIFGSLRLLYILSNIFSLNEKSLTVLKMYFFIEMCHNPDKNYDWVFLFADELVRSNSPYCVCGIPVNLTTRNILGSYMIACFGYILVEFANKYYQ